MGQELDIAAIFKCQTKPRTLQAQKKLAKEILAKAFGENNQKVSILSIEFNDQRETVIKFRYLTTAKNYDKALEFFEEEIEPKILKTISQEENPRINILLVSFKRNG